MDVPLPAAYLALIRRCARPWPRKGESWPSPIVNSKRGTWSGIFSCGERGVAGLTTTACTARRRVTYRPPRGAPSGHHWNPRRPSGSSASPTSLAFDVFGVLRPIVTNITRRVYSWLKLKVARRVIFNAAVSTTADAQGTQAVSSVRLVADPHNVSEVRDLVAEPLCGRACAP